MIQANYSYIGGCKSFDSIDGDDGFKDFLNGPYIWRMYFGETPNDILGAIIYKATDFGRKRVCSMAQNKEILSVIDYDLGVMQINTRNIARYGIDEKETYLNYKENMLYGADIIRGCYETLKNKTNISNILECYNRGSDIKHLNNSDRSYLSKFLKNYKSL